MSAVIVVGAQWGDEGKGKVVDLYAPYADLVVRYSGGANAGHTLVVRGEKVVLHLVPSGILHPTCRCLIAQGTVIDPEVLLREIDALVARGLDLDGRLLVSQDAHVVLPHHKTIDGLREGGEGAIGTTKRGIGPAYEDKIARRGLRIADLLDAARFRKKLERNLESWRPVIEGLGGEVPALESIAAPYLDFGNRLRKRVAATAQMVHEAIEGGKRVLLEGAQGTMLDIDHGTYPFVTSSNAIAGGACTGAGIGPTKIDRVIGIAKAYTTRVGGGPFPTELHDATGEQLRKAGAEFGSTTGRPRRCGWLDIPALRLAVRVNGLSELAITKLDVLSDLPSIEVGVAYELDGRRLEEPPTDDFDRVRPIYESMPGWSGSIAKSRTRSDLPEAAQAYLRRIEALVDCRVGVVSVGPDREDTSDLRNPFDAPRA